MDTVPKPSVNIGYNYYQSLLRLRSWNPQPFLLLSFWFSVVALGFYREELWTSNLVGKSSVGLGLKQCLHRKLIPSSHWDFVLEYRGWGEG